MNAMTPTPISSPGPAGTPRHDDPHAARRAALYERIGPRAVAIVPGAREVRRNGTNPFRFRQSSDLLYLTGFPEPDGCAVFAPGKPQRFTMFLRPRDAAREVWYGSRVGIEDAPARLGCDQAFDHAQLEARLADLIDDSDEVYWLPGDDPELDAMLMRALQKLHKNERNGKRAPRRLVDITIALHELRLIKDEAALTTMRRAAAITVEAHELTMRAARVGKTESELTALVEYVFAKHEGAPGYEVIIGAGNNACVLHYTGGTAQIAPDELLLVDAGCEWRGFTADVTRTYPVGPAAGGPARFTPAQRRLYDLVLESQLAAIAISRPGATIEEIYLESARVLTRGLVRLGLLHGEPEELIARGEHKRYYLHRCSHFLGIDVHDVGLYFPRSPAGAAPYEPRTLAPGMVITVEPGLYIPRTAEVPPGAEEYRGIGIRIEDDVLITASGHEVLTTGITKDPGELERLVGTGATLTL